MKTKKLLLTLMICTLQKSNGMCPRQRTNEAKQATVTEILIKNGNIDQRLISFANQRPILLLADDDENIDLLEKVLEKKPTINTTDFIRATALHRASRNNAIKNLTALLKHCSKLEGFDLNSFINARTALQKTALHEAIEHSAVSCAKLLLRYKTTINQQTNKGDTEAHLVFKNNLYRLSNTEFNNRLELLVILYGYGANFDIRTAQGKTVLSLAEQTHAQHPNELSKKVKTITLLQSLKLLPVIAVQRNNNQSFCSWLPADIVWLVGNFLVGTEVPRR